MNQPSLRVRFHPLQKANHVGFGEMVREEGADDEINRLVGLHAKISAATQRMALVGWRGFGGDGNGVGVEIEAGEFDGDAARASPALDAAQAVAVSATDVENAERLSRSATA